MTKIEQMIEQARSIMPSRDQREAQRRSFAYGNVKIENERVTHEMVDRAADAPKK